MEEKKNPELEYVKIKCHKCACENIIEVKKLIDSSDPIRCNFCGEKILVMGERTIVFEE